MKTNINKLFSTEKQNLLAMIYGKLSNQNCSELEYLLSKMVACV